VHAAGVKKFRAMNQKSRAEVCKESMRHRSPPLG
jgi:hypothetical protein